MEKKNLLTKLVSNILKTNDYAEIKKGIKKSEDILSISLTSTNPKSFRKWLRKWKKEISQENINDLLNLKNKLEGKELSIFSLFDLLKFSKSEFDDEKSLKEEKEIKNPSEYTNVLTEEQIIQEILILLQGGNGDFFTFKNDKFHIEGIIPHHYMIFIKQFLAIAQCVFYITEIPSKLIGIIGQSISLHFKNELESFINFILKFDVNHPTFLSLQAYLHCEEVEILQAYAFIACILIQQGTNYLTTLSYTQSHGNEYVKKIGAKMIESGNVAMLEFIRDWVLYGTIDDPYNEFFITMRDEKPDPASWWRERYVLVRERIPIVLGDGHLTNKHIISMILSCGRALNYTQRFKTIGFSADKPLYQSKTFDLEMIPSFLESAMSTVMDLIMKENWLIGHLNMIHDFMLFCRGDFAYSLYKNSLVQDKTESINILSHVRNSIYVGNSYVNPATKENLMDYLDLKLTNEKDQAIEINPKNINIVYLLHDPINSVISRSDMATYSRISKILWKMKQIQMELSRPWKTFKTPSVIKEMQIDDVAIRKFNLLRSILLYASLSLNEWLWTDVILTNRKAMEENLKKAKRFDEVQKIVKKHIQNICRGMLLADQFSTECTAFTTLVGVFDSFIDEMKQFFEYLNDLENEYEYTIGTGEIDEYFVSAAESELKDFSETFDNISTSFKAKLKVLYVLTSNNLSIPELSHLELRLKSFKRV